METTGENYGWDYLMAIRKLQLPNRKSTNKENFPYLEEFIIAMHNTLYEAHKADLFKGKLCINKEEDLSTVFCSELVSVIHLLSQIIQ
jgi:hypothetical protein